MHQLELVSKRLVDHPARDASDVRLIGLCVCVWI